MSLSNHLISQRFALTINPCSTNIMREEPNFRQRDIEWGRREGIAKAEAIIIAKEKRVLQEMLEECEITREQVDCFFKYMAELEEKK
jgi:hypothetical protein